MAKIIKIADHLKKKTKEQKEKLLKKLKEARKEIKDNG